MPKLPAQTTPVNEQAPAERCTVIVAKAALPTTTPVGVGSARLLSSPIGEDSAVLFIKGALGNLWSDDPDPAVRPIVMAVEIVVVEGSVQELAVSVAPLGTLQIVRFLFYKPFPNHCVFAIAIAEAVRFPRESLHKFCVPSLID